MKEKNKNILGESRVQKNKEEWMWEIEHTPI